MHARFRIENTCPKAGNKHDLFGSKKTNGHGFFSHIKAPMEIDMSFIYDKKVKDHEAWQYYILGTKSFSLYVFIGNTFDKIL